MPDDAIAAIHDLVGAYARKHRCPSLAWGIVRDGVLAGTGATGALDDGRAPSPSTVYRIASMTKSFTAATVLALRDEGALHLDDPIAAYGPELAGVTGPTRDTAPIRLRDLLSMSSGLASDDAWADRHLDLTDAQLDALIAAGSHFAATPGTTFEYSNLGYALAGRIVERATGIRLQEQVTTRFLEPLGMSRTTWTPPSHDDWARPYRRRDSAHVAEQLVDDGVLAPLGGLWSTVEDLAIWSAWLEGAFPARDDEDEGPLRRSSRREMQQMHRYAGTRKIAGRSAPNGYGYGLRIRDDPALATLVGHSGGLPGYGSNMRWMPGRRVAVIALANVTYAPMDELTLRIFDALDAAGALPATELPVPPIVEQLARALATLLLDWDDGQADAVFTDNAAWDEPYDRRRAKAEKLFGGAGPLTVTGIKALSAAAADVMLVDATGAAFKLELELAPLVPARIQSYSLERARVPTRPVDGS